MLQEKAGINIPILKESPADVTAAKKMKFNKGGWVPYLFEHDRELNLEVNTEFLTNLFCRR